MSIPIIYVYASTKGEEVYGELRSVPEYTVAVAPDGAELFRTDGFLDPFNLTYRADQHTLLHSACVRAHPDGYEITWGDPPVAKDPEDGGTIDIEEHLEAVSDVSEVDEPEVQTETLSKEASK